MQRLNQPNQGNTASYLTSNRLTQAMTNIQNTLNGTVLASSFSKSSMTSYKVKGIHPLSLQEYNDLGIKINKLPLTITEKNIIAGALSEAYLINKTRQNSGATKNGAQNFVVQSIKHVYNITPSVNQCVPWSTSEIDITLVTPNNNIVYISHKAGTTTGGNTNNKIIIGISEIQSFINSNPSSNKHFIFLCELPNPGNQAQQQQIAQLCSSNTNVHVVYNLVDLYPILDLL